MPQPGLSPKNGRDTCAGRSRRGQRWEQGVISEALKQHGGNRLRAAAALGISRKTLYQKLNKYGLGSA